MHRVLATTLAALIVPLSLWAQKLPKPEEIVRLSAEPAQLGLRQGQSAPLKLKVEIIPGFHINSNQPLEEYLIPTEVFLPADSPFELAEAKFPKAEMKTFSFAPGEKLAVFEGRVEIGLKLRARFNAPAREHKLAVGLRYQACNDEICLRPAEQQLSLSIAVRPKARARTAKPAS